MVLVIPPTRQPAIERQSYHSPQNIQMNATHQHRLGRVEHDTVDAVGVAFQLLGQGTVRHVLRVHVHVRVDVCPNVSVGNTHVAAYT